MKQYNKQNTNSLFIDIFLLMAIFISPYLRYNRNTCSSYESHTVGIRTDCVQAMLAVAQLFDIVSLM